jgi:Holliday junction resolvasome RuvABC endonuclease subunit
MPRRQRGPATARRVILSGTGTSIAVDGPPCAQARSGRPKGAVSGSAAIPNATRVLGLDLAARTTGYAMLVGGEPVDHGSFTLPDRARNESLASWMERRSAELGRHVGLLIRRHAPEIVGFEVIDETRPSWSGGSKGREMVVSQALGRAQGMLVAQWRLIGGGARLAAVPITLAKRTATGRVNASKAQVAYGLRTFYGFDLRGWNDDESDALSIALAAREML